MFPESLIYGQLSSVTGFKIWSKYSGNFSVGVPQFDITGLLGTELKRLCILGRKYNFPRLVVFLKLQVKYLSSFSDSNLRLHNRINILLLLSSKLVIIFLLSSTSSYILVSRSCLEASQRQSSLSHTTNEEPLSTPLSK